jgi:hypothetical protein
MLDNGRELARVEDGGLCGVRRKDRAVVIEGKSRSELSRARRGGASSIWAERKVKVKR